MVKGVKKDHLISSFLDFLYIEKGLSKNTVHSYENDINSFSKCVPIIFISWLLSKQGNAKAEPIAPAPIITILDILIFKKYFFDNQKNRY